MGHAELVSANYHYIVRSKKKGGKLENFYSKMSIYEEEKYGAFQHQGPTPFVLMFVE